MIYLDYQATTALAPEAKEAMLHWLDGPEGDGYGNPHSSHRLGRQAEAAVELARERVAALFPAGGQVVFTSLVNHPGTRAQPWLREAMEEVAVPEGFRLVRS